MDFPSYYISGQSGWTNTDNMPYNGHFENLVHADPVCSQVRQALPCANPMLGQLACSPVGKTYPPSGASGILQQAMDVSIMTSPPSNPYGNYSIFSTVTPSVSPAYSQVQQAQPCANPFVGQLACSSVRRTSPQSHASDLLQQATDLSMFTMMTSPPNNPYSNYGMFSPVTPGVSTAHNPGYLSNLQRNPMFQDLQMLLNQECYGVQVPANLITTSWNLMQLPSMDSSAGVIGGSQDVYLRHMQLQDKLLKVRINPYVSSDGLKVENEYSTKVGQIEMGRYQALVSNMGNTVLKSAVNSYYDKERLMLVQKVEADLDKLIVKVEEIQKSVASANVMQKESSQGKPLIRNAVKTDRGEQQLTFGGLNDAGEKDSFDYGFKSDFEDLGVDVEAILDNDKVKDINKNCAQMISMSQSCGLKQNNTALQDEKCAEDTNFFQPDSTVNLSPVKPVSDTSCLINNANLTTPDQCGSSQAAFLDSSLSLLKNQHKSTVICTSELRNNPSVELSPSNDQSDFLLRIACGSSGKSNDIQSNLQSQAQSPIVSFHPELQASSNSQQSSYLDKPTDTNSGMNHSKENTNVSSHVPSDLPCLKTHNVLSNDAANILSMCELQLQHPDPTKEEAKELAEMTGVTQRQDKKWMVNKHSHFSTLSITGDNHPIKFKCEGKGKKRKHSEVGKDD